MRIDQTLSHKLEEYQQRDFGENFDYHDFTIPYAVLLVV